MEYRVLGPFEVRAGAHVVELGGEKPRALLVILVLHRNQVVLADRLVDDLWGESPPATALRTLHAYVSRLRKALNGDGGSPGSNGGVLVTQGRGYLLRVAPGELDLERFGELVERGRDALAADEPGEAAAVLREALGLWRGPPLADFAYQPFAQAAIAQLEELQLAAVEERLNADLALGRARELVAELRDQVGHHPLRERLRGQLMLALYRYRRQAEALGVYQDFRHVLSDELGLEPGPALRELELAILRRDPALDLRAGRSGPDRRELRSPAPPRAAGRTRRRRWMLAGGSVLVALVLAAVVVAWSGGRAEPSAVPGDAVGAISPSGGAIRAVVPLASSPSAVAAGDGAVWVASYNQGTVSRIDPATRAVVQTIQAGTTPSGIAVGAGAVWVANNYGETVSRIDPSVNRVVQTIPVGNAPAGVAVGYGSVWAANSSDGTLTRIDEVTGDVTGTITLGGAGATDVAAGAGAVWVSDEAGDRVLRVDPRAGQVTATINVGSGPTAIGFGFGSVWVANSLDGTVTRIDPATGTVDQTIQVGDGADAITTGNGAVWVASPYAGTVSRIDPSTGTVARRIAVGSRPQGLALADGLLWVGAQAAATSHRGGTLTVLVQYWVTTADPVLSSAPGLDLTNDGLTAYRRAGGSGSVQVVPDLAVSLPAPADGGTTYTFQLRHGIRYSNGELVRPEDFRRALQRDLTFGPDPAYGDPFADVVGGAARTAHPSRCDLSKGVVVDDAANTVTFHLVAPDPEFLARLSLQDAEAVPVGTPDHDVGLHPIPATGPYEWASISPRVAILVRNPYFREWSHAARPDGYPDRIIIRRISSPQAEITDVERGTADYEYDGVPADRMGEVQTRFASQLHVNPAIGTDALVLNTRVAPFNDVRVRQAINYAVDRGEIARLIGQGTRPACQMLPPGLPGYQRYCPYTLDPSPSGTWLAPDLVKAERLIAASRTRGTPITIWDLGPFQTDYTPAYAYLTSLFDRLGYPTRVIDLANNTAANGQFSDSRMRVQAAINEFGASYPSASQLLASSFGCRYFVPDSAANTNGSEFCDPKLDAQMNSALAAESNNSPDAAALWAQADRTATDDAPAVPLTTPSETDFVSARVGDYQYSFQQGVLLDQLWVRLARRPQTFVR
ncbi:MAG TPA: BTAD domain-containing putative transcriptional regulator [Streptosporangiaceae bacterium]|nr:BTAD domain-containing putative transcriptional regulator [Streptosporangiaceae bacterium]